MTMVAGCLFGDEAVIIADSRVTWGATDQRVYGDLAQKILPLGKDLAYAFAGDIAISNSILSEMRLRIKKSPKLINHLSLPTELSRVARFQYRKHMLRRGNKDISVQIVLTGLIAGKVFLWIFESPRFLPRLVRSGYIIFGSGATVEPRLNLAYAKSVKSSATLKNKANVLISELESELKKQGVESAGGLFQVILISAQGIAPLNYGFMELRPEKPGIAKEMTVSRGIWTQRDLSKTMEVPLLEPRQIITLSPVEERFHDFELPTPKEQKLRWYLNYLITCLSLDRSTDKIIFNDVLSQIGAPVLPIELPLIVALGFWGPLGKHILNISLDDNGKQTPICVQEINIPYPSELNEFAIPIRLFSAQPGPVFINCYIDDFLISRKSLYLARMDEIHSTTAEDARSQNEINKRILIAKHQECSDPELSEAGCFLEYFILCQQCVVQNGRYEFRGEARAIYWKKYPLLFKTQLAASLRLPRGKHGIRIDLVNAQSSKRLTIAQKEICSTYDCIMNRIHGDLVIKIPEPGVYFVSLYVDEQFISSEILPAETEKPKYSYSLPEDAIRAVSEGELIILVRRSRSQKEV